MSIWKTLQEKIDMIKQTPYERDYNITITKKEIIEDWGDLKVLAVRKSNGETGLVILFKPSKSSELWDNWYPSDNQMKHLNKIHELYKNQDKHNSQFWKK